MIGIRQRMRLLMERWMGSGGAERLAQLLYTMFDPDIPVEHHAPVSMVAQPGVPPFQVRNWTPGDVMFQFTDSSGTQFGNMTISNDGIGFQTPNTGAGGGQEEQEQQEQEGAGGGNLFPSEIISGSGATYSCKKFLSTRGGAFEPVMATHPSILGSEDIPDGTKCQLMLLPDGVTYEIMGVPTWL